MMDFEFTVPEYVNYERNRMKRRHVAADSASSWPSRYCRSRVIYRETSPTVNANVDNYSDKMIQRPEERDTVLLKQCILDTETKEKPRLARCGSSSSLSELHEPCRLESSCFVVTEMASPSDDTLTTTYTLRKRRSYSDDRGVQTPPRQPKPQNDQVAPDSPSLGLRVRNSINRSKRRIGEMRQRLRRPRQDRSKWLIPADHPYKIVWDILTVTLSFMGAFTTHASIRDRSFGHSSFVVFCEVWFLLDILLNFVTEHKTSEGLVIRDGKAVWARYLTTWFVVDALSLIPWESLYVKPIIEMQNRRGFFKKTFFRSRAVIRVTRVLRGRHFRLFGQVASHTKHAGVGANRLLRLLIKYVPKYLLFYRNMKGVLAVRTLRQVHWFRKVMKSFVTQKEDDDTFSLSSEDSFEEDDEDDDIVHVFEYEVEQPYS